MAIFFSLIGTIPPHPNKLFFDSVFFGFTLSVALLFPFFPDAPFLVAKAMDTNCLPFYAERLSRAPFCLTSAGPDVRNLDRRPAPSGRVAPF